MRDLEIAATDECQHSTRLIEAHMRLANLRKRLIEEQLDILHAFVLDDNPSSWARLNGLAQREGLPKLRAALERLITDLLSRMAQHGLRLPGFAL